MSGRKPANFKPVITNLDMKKTNVFLIIRALAALVLAQSLFFKFTAAQEAVQLFSQLSNTVKGDASLEGTMRLGSGLLELVSVLLLMMKKPRIISVGALIAVVALAGALGLQVAVTGIDHSDGLVRFAITLLGLVASLVVLFRFRGSLPVLGKFT